MHHEVTNIVSMHSSSRLCNVRRPQVEIAENHVCYFVLTNMARFSLEVSLEATGPCELLQYLEATPKRATTDIGTQLQLSLSFCPKNVCNLQNIVLSIKVTKTNQISVFKCFLSGFKRTLSLMFNLVKITFKHLKC